MGVTFDIPVAFLMVLKYRIILSLKYRKLELIVYFRAIRNSTEIQSVTLCDFIVYLCTVISILIVFLL
jgi:hypothetical protein